MLFRRVVSRFVGTAPGLAASLKTVHVGNAGELWRIAHSLKSSAAALGANARRSLREIEQLARDKGFDAVQPLLCGLDPELAAALKSLCVMTGNRMSSPPNETERPRS